MSSSRNLIRPDVARTSPTSVFAIEKLTPSTAWTLTSPPPRIRWTKPWNTGKYTRRSCTSRRASFMTTDLVQVTCDLPAVLAHGPNLGEDGLAQGHSLLAPRVERAPDGVSEQARRGPWNRVQLRRVEIDH